AIGHQCSEHRHESATGGGWFVRHYRVVAQWAPRIFPFAIHTNGDGAGPSYYCRPNCDWPDFSYDSTAQSEAEVTNPCARRFSYTTRVAPSPRSTLAPFGRNYGWIRGSDLRNRGLYDGRGESSWLHACPDDSNSHGDQQRQFRHRHRAE